MLSFVLDGYRTEEVGAALNQEGIAVRAGHHCAQPILRRFGARDHRAPVAGVLQHLRGSRPLVAVLRRLARHRTTEESQPIP